MPSLRRVPVRLTAVKITVTMVNHYASESPWPAPEGRDHSRVPGFQDSKLPSSCRQRHPFEGTEHPYLRNQVPCVAVLARHTGSIPREPYSRPGPSAPCQARSYISNYTITRPMLLPSPSNLSIALSRALLSGIYRAWARLCLHSDEHQIHHGIQEAIDQRTAFSKLGAHGHQ